MNLDFLLKHIAEAERHIVEAQRLIQQHHEIIAQLRENDGDAKNAERLLDSTLGVQTTHERYLAYLRGLLAK